MSVPGLTIYAKWQLYTTAWNQQAHLNIPFWFEGQDLSWKKCRLEWANNRRMFP